MSKPKRDPFDEPARLIAVLQAMPPPDQDYWINRLCKLYPQYLSAEDVEIARAMGIKLDLE